MSSKTQNKKTIGSKQIDFKNRGAKQTDFLKTQFKTESKKQASKTKIKKFCNGRIEASR